MDAERLDVAGSKKSMTYPIESDTDHSPEARR